MEDISLLISGFERTMQKHGALVERLAVEGQKPKFLLVSCMDSRCAPETLLNLELGTAFSHRPMGGFVHAYKEGSELDAKLTFSLLKGVKNIVLIGHTQCGAVAGLSKDVDDPHIKPWLKVANPAKQAALEKVGDADLDTLCREIERQVVILGLKNLLTYPEVSEAVESGALKLHGLFYDMHNKALLRLNTDSRTFEQLAPNENNVKYA